MADVRTTCVVVVLLVVAVQSARLRRNEYLVDVIRDASIAGDYIVGIGDDCSDDDSSESLELGYVIINKREAPEDERERTHDQTAASSFGVAAQRLPNVESVAFV